MPTIKCIAKKDFTPFFKKGDKVNIVPILYEEDTLIRDEIYGVFDKKGVMLKIADKFDLGKKGYDIRKISDKLYAPKGSYKDSYIELEDGRQYPGSLIRDYNDYFEKIS